MRLQDQYRGYLPEDLVLAARREEIIGYLLKVSTRLFQCKSAEMQAWNRWT